MQINTVDDLLKAIEEKRVEKGISSRQLSMNIGKTAGLYWWIKKRGTELSLATTLDLIKALDLKLTVK